MFFFDSFMSSNADIRHAANPKTAPITSDALSLSCPIAIANIPVSTDENGIITATAFAETYFIAEVLTVQHIAFATIPTATRMRISRTSKVKTNLSIGSEPMRI